MRPHARALLAAGLLAAGAARGGAAQAVTGEVRSEEEGWPIAGARLLLLNDVGTPVDSALADAAGRFRLAAPAPGIFTLYFHLDGYTGIPSPALQLEAGRTLAYQFRVPLIPSGELQRMSGIMTADPRLQRPLPELCGEPFRASEAGFLVGVVRARGSGAPLAGVRVSVPGLSGAGPGAVANEQGVYYLCNVPVGRAVTVLATLPDGTVDTARVEIRAGTASWFDLEVGRRR